MNQPVTGCPYEMWDGSYVLGSLSPAERREFEAHLDGCQHCSRGVRDLAGLPGLLGRIGPEVIDAPEPEPVPETLLPRLSRAVRRHQQRRTWLTAGIAAAAAVAVTTGGVLALDRPSSAPSADRKPPVVQPSGQIMTQLARDPMTVRVALTSVPWGTRLDLTCSYPPNTVTYEGGAYALVVHTKDGRSQRVATWNGVPARSMQVSAATSAWTKDIRSVEVTRLDGSPIAELTL
jgi:anti-sigma factor RsiW